MCRQLEPGRCCDQLLSAGPSLHQLRKLWGLGLDGTGGGRHTSVPTHTHRAATLLTSLLINTNNNTFTTSTIRNNNNSRKMNNPNNTKKHQCQKFKKIWNPSPKLNNNHYHPHKSKEKFRSILNQFGNITVIYHKGTPPNDIVRLITEPRKNYNCGVLLTLSRLDSHQRTYIRLINMMIFLTATVMQMDIKQTT